MKWDGHEIRPQTCPQPTLRFVIISRCYCYSVVSFHNYTRRMGSYCSAEFYFHRSFTANPTDGSFIETPSWVQADSNRKRKRKDGNEDGEKGNPFPVPYTKDRKLESLGFRSASSIGWLKKCPTGQNAISRQPTEILLP